MTNTVQNPIIDELNVFNDTTPGSLPGALKVSGFTTNIPNGTEISILISDSEGNVTTAIVVVEDGAFELVNIDTSMLKPGDLNVNASVNDFTIGVDHARVIPPEVTPISVTETVLDVNNKISIEGTTKGFAPGQVLNLVVRDVNGTSVTATAAVQSNGSFSVSGISTQGLADGTLIVDVLAQTPNGSVSIENADNVQLTNLVPEGTNNTLAVNEDTGRVLTVADFGYVQGNTNFAMTGIKIAGLTSVGTLKLNGNALLMDDFVSLAQINAGQLVFQGAQDGNGTAYDSFKFKVLDNRPTYNEDPTANTITFNVTPINDVPVLTTAGAIGTIDEDSASAVAVALWNTAPVYTSGPSNEASQTLSYKINTIPGLITLFKADGTTAVTAGTTLTAAEFADLKYKTVANANGTGNITFDVIDSGSGTAPNVNTLSSQSISMTVNAVNDAPVVTTAGAIATVNEDSASATATTLWSTAPVFAAGPSDESTQTLTYKITAIPTFITLFKADGTTAVTAGTTVTATEFAALKYKTVANANGTGSVTFDVIDSGSSTAPNVNTLSSQSVSMTVTAVNDVPVVTTAGAITTVNEDSASATATTLWSTAPAFAAGPIDESTQTLTYKITAIPTFITLFKADGTTVVTAGTTVTATEFAALKYKTVANANGTGSVTFDVIDSGSSTAPNVNTLSSQSVSMTVTAVNDAPVVTTAGAIAIVNEDSASATATTLWSTAPAFAAGPSDESTQTLTYKITAIPAFITLFKADGTTAVTAGTTVTATEFAALKYKTVANANGTGSVTFDVIDSGSSTAPNVNTLSSQSVSMTVTAVNDVPVVTTAGAITTVNEDSASATATTLWSTAPAYGTGGGSDESTQTLTYKITAIPAFITLFKADGTTAVTAGTTVTATEFAALKYKTVANANGTGSVTFDVIDSGSSTAPNVNTLSSQSVSMTVTAVNDVPVVTTAGAITTVNEDSASATATTLWSTAPAYGTGGGSDESTQTLTYKITAIPAFITLFKADGTTAVTAGTTVTATEFAALKYKTVANANGTGSVTFDVIDSGSSTAPNVNTLSSQSVSMTVTAVNDVPVVTTAGAITTVNEDSASATATTLWSTAPAFAAGPIDESTQTLTYKITAIPTFITLFKADGTTAVTAGTTVTATEFAALKYKTVANANGTGSVTFDVIDSGSSTAPNVNTLSSQSVSMTVTAVNDVPVVTTAGAITTVNEDSASATATTLWSTAPAFAAGPIDESTQTLTYKITAIPTFITLFKADGTTVVTAGTTVTATEFAALKYKTVANANGTGSVTFDVIDSGSSTAPNVNTLSSQSVSMTVNAVNDAPVLANTVLDLTAVIQGSANPVGAVGVLVSSLVGGVSDVDASAEKGIAITGFNSAKGQLFFSTNGGTNWTEITSATEATARLLKSDTDNRVYFKAAAGTQGTVADALTFRAWDATTGTEGLTGDASVNDGTTAFSKDTDTVSEYVDRKLVINPVSVDNLVNAGEDLVITGKAESGNVTLDFGGGVTRSAAVDANGDWALQGRLVRYVRITKLANTGDGLLALSEIKVMQGATNLAAGKPVVVNGVSTTSILTDGSVASYEEYGAGSNEFSIQLDLGGYFKVDSIDVHGRTGQWGRINDGGVLFTSTQDMTGLTAAQLTPMSNVNRFEIDNAYAPSNAENYPHTFTNAMWTNAVKLTEGANAVQARATAAAGLQTAATTVNLDATPPATTVTSAALSSDTGTSNTDFITSVAAQTITGNLSANLATGEKVMVSMDNGITWVAATAAVGTSTWSLPGVTLSGTNTLQAKVVDTAGNGSTPFTKVYALVTVSDLTVGITRIDDNAGTASVVLSGGTSNDTTPQLTGSLGGATQGAALATNEVVNVYRTPNLAAATVLQAGSLANTQILSGNPLTHYIMGDGNYGTTGDVYLPTTPGDGHMVVFSKTSNWGLAVYAGNTLVGNVGTANVGSGGQDNLYFKWDAAKGQWLTGTNALTKVGTAVVTTSAGGQSTWTLTDNTGLGNSDSVNYIAQVENTAGTFGRQSTPGALDWRYNVDNVAPSSITLIGTDDVGPVTGPIAANSVTNDNKPTFSGNTEANAVVSVFDGATLLGTTTANSTGAWSFTPTNAMTTGAHSVTATATDVHGNTSAPSTALPFSIDTTAPVAVADTNTGTEDITTPLTGNVGTNDTSKDGSETYALVSSATGAKGTLALNANGSYTYTRTSSANEITANLVETFTYSVTDAAGNTTQSTLKITLTPVNDAATFTGDLTKTITETNAAQTVGGTLTVTDVDSPTTVVGQVAANGSAGYGKFTISPAGVWSYTMNSAQNQFVAGQTYDDTLTVTTADGTQQVIKVTITGTNDAPTMASSSSTLGLITFVENGAAIVARGGSITLADVDSANLQGATVRVVNFTDATSFVPGDLLTYTIPGGSGITGAYNTSTGVLTFTGTATQAQYQTLLDSVKYSNLREDLAGGGRNVYWSVKDASGATSNEVLSRLSVSRLNDAPVLADTNLNLTTIEPTTAETLPTGQMGVLVSNLVGGVTDGDGTGVAKGIAVIGANDALGKVFFSVDNGANWFSPAGTISSNAALLLKADAATRVYFRPNAGVEGNIPDAMTIRAWDTTDNKVSLVSNNVSLHAITAIGGITAYSATTDTVALSVLTTASPGLSGTAAANTLTGTAGNDVIVGNGGADLIDAKEGNDKVVLNNDNVAALNASSAPNIDGGTGFNTLKLTGTEVLLDLTNVTVQSNVDNFSVVDITSNVNNQLKLNLQNVQNLSAAADNANTPVDESKMLVVHADTGDAVVLQDAASWSVVNSLSGSSLNTIYGANYGFSSTRRYSQYSKDGATLFVDELAPVADIVGTSGNNTLTGTASAEVIYGNGGVDTINAGAGNDTVILTASSISALNAGTNTAAINGEAGVNTLKISGINQTLDLTNLTVNNKLDNFNVIDLKQGSGNKFKLHLDQVLSLAGGTDNGSTAVDESRMLVLQGNGGQQVNRLQLVDAIDWTSVTNLGGTSLQNTYGAEFGFEAGRSYTQYTNGTANLFVDQTLFVEALV